MHCEDPGCLRACPADGAIVQYTQRHRRLPAGELHRLPVLRVGLPVRHSEVQPHDQEGLQVHAVLRSRRPGTRAGVHQGVSDRLPEVRDEGRHARAGRQRARSNCASIPGSRMPASTIRRRSAARTSIYVLHDITKPELYGGLPANPQIPVDATPCGSACAKPIAPAAGALRGAGRVFPLHHRRAEGTAAAVAAGGAAMNDARRAIRRARARSRVDAHGRTIVHEDELLRHPVYTRVAALGRRDLLRPGVAVRVCDLHAVALSLADAALRRRADDPAAASLVQPRIRRVSSRCRS